MAALTGIPAFQADLAVFRMARSDHDLSGRLRRAAGHVERGLRELAVDLQRTGGAAVYTAGLLGAEPSPAAARAVVSANLAELVAAAPAGR